MKAHKYWGIGAFVCMISCMYTGSNMKSKNTHKYCALGALFCMIMAMYTGQKMINGGRKKKSKDVEVEEGAEESVEV